MGLLQGGIDAASLPLGSSSRSSSSAAVQQQQQQQQQQQRRLVSSTSRRLYSQGDKKTFSSLEFEYTPKLWAEEETAAMPVETDKAARRQKNCCSISVKHYLSSVFLILLSFSYSVLQHHHLLLQQQLQHQQAAAAKVAAAAAATEAAGFVLVILL